ncbi:MAG: amidohydrolase family protein [Chloroflexi bacterium]|nr:amidohydrolase family protein [Chloroflexota bacterium]
MRNGYRIFDADTHFHASAETLEPFLDPMLRDMKDELQTREFRTGWAGEEMPEPYTHLYRLGQERGWGEAPPRVLGEAGPRPNAQRHFQNFQGFTFPTPGGSDWDSDIRVRDMDEEGVDVHLMVPGAASGHPDPAVDMAMLRSVHRQLDDMCSRHPGRLTSLILATARDVEGSVLEIKRYADSPWAKGVWVSLPVDYPVDHPDLHPIWAAADDAGLTITHHSFATGYPGYRDLWDNPFVGRTASHPWGAMRMISAFIGAGLLDKYPNLNLAILESGFGWLPFWMKRMEDQVHYMGYVADGLRTIEEYMTGGRFFAGIVIHEGEQMTRMVSDFMGDHVLMFGSDYPHAESRFPRSADIVLGWDTLGDDRMRKLMWENAARCFHLE